MTRSAHVPVRTCLGCGRRNPQAEMVRIVRDAAGELHLDERRTAPGRGGYLHRSADCWTRFARGKGMIRSLGSAVERTARAALVATRDDRMGDER